MSVAVRPFAKGKGWEVDIITVTPRGEEIRERRKAPVSSKSAALRWGLAREREIIMHGRRRRKPRSEEVKQPTFAVHAKQFLADCEEGDKFKPSYLATQRSIVRVHLVPTLGKLKLDAITDARLKTLSRSLSKGRTRKTVNNVLSVLKSILTHAVKAKVIDEMPCSIQVEAVAANIDMPFHEAEELESLRDAAQRLDWRAHLAVLLGSEAGLRCGEILGLETKDVDLRRGHLLVRRSVWRGHETLPKGGRPRRVPLTGRLQKALQKYRRLSSSWVLCRDDGKPLTEKILRVWVQKAASAAGVQHDGLHVLRHTFATRLMERRVPPRVAQKLLGHADIKTTLGYQHVSETAETRAIRLLDDRSRGEIVESAEVALPIP